MFRESHECTGHLTDREETESLPLRAYSLNKARQTQEKTTVQKRERGRFVRNWLKRNVKKERGPRETVPGVKSNMTIGSEAMALNDRGGQLKSEVIDTLDGRGSESSLLL